MLIRLICFNIMATLRSPICGIFGHVDSGKTSFLSKLKSFETIEAGGITQGVSSIFISIDKIKALCKKIIDLKELFRDGIAGQEAEIKIPGILFIDTPGHEAFSNFRVKASQICDLAIVIVDIEKGIENQTKESIQLLNKKNIPFIIILTKLDKVAGWQIVESPNLRQSLKNQTEETIVALNVHMEDIKYELSKININSEFYFKNKTPRKTVSIIPISNISKEGFNDLINYLIFIVQNFMGQKLVIEEKPTMFVMEKSFDTKLGWTCNVILSSGKIKSGDSILFATQNGPVKSVIRNIIGLKYNEQINRYLRAYQNEQEASDSITLFAPNLENLIPGTFINVFNSEKEYDLLVKNMDTVEITESFINKIKKNDVGYYLFTSTESEFEAGYNVCTESNIPITNGSCGPLNEKEIDVFEIHLNKLLKISNLDEYRIMLYYATREPKPELVEYAKAKNIHLIHNPVIYKLIDNFNELKIKLINNRKEQYKKEGHVFLPFEIKLLKQHVYMKGGGSDLLIGFKVISGTINIGTEIICIKTSFNKKDKKESIEIVNLGKITKMEKNHKEISTGIKNDEICVRTSNSNKLVYEKDFSDKDVFYSNMTRPSVELLKRDFKTDLSKEEWLLTAKIVKLINI